VGSIDDKQAAVDDLKDSLDVLTQLVASCEPMLERARRWDDAKDRRA